MVTSDFRPEVEKWPFRACGVSSSMKHQLKAPSNRGNFAIYTEIGVMESNADVRIILPKPPKYTPVSYTHLTLPTILRV